MRVHGPLSIERQARRLVPWDNAAITRLSSRWHGRMVYSLGHVTTAGRGEPLEGGGALMVFRLHRVRRRGSLRVWTSAQRLGFDLHHDVVSVTVDGQLVGVVLLRDGTLTDADGRAVGIAPRGREREWVIGPVRLSRRQLTYPVLVGGRYVATLTTATDRATTRPLVMWRADELDASERQWLLIMCALEIGYFGTLLAHMHRRASMRAGSVTR